MKSKINFMKEIFLVAIFILTFVFCFSFSVNAGWVRGYYRRNGAYVPGYYRSNPNGLRYDNYSYKLSQSLFNDSYFNSFRNYNYNWYRPSYLYQNNYWSGYFNYRFNK